LRKGRDLTLKQLANKTALSVSLISQIELGKSAASISTLRKLAAARRADGVAVRRRLTSKAQATDATGSSAAALRSRCA
jgi:transcriptional regulator with XRE-family HTH domain